MGTLVTLGGTDQKHAAACLGTLDSLAGLQGVNLWMTVHCRCHWYQLHCWSWVKAAQ